MLEKGETRDKRETNSWEEFLIPFLFPKKEYCSLDDVVYRGGA